MLHCWLHLLIYMYMNFEGKVKLYAETPISRHVVEIRTVVGV